MAPAATECRKRLAVGRVPKMSLRPRSVPRVSRCASWRRMQIDNDATALAAAETIPVEVCFGGGHFAVLAARAAAPGAVLMRLEGEIVARPSRYSVQVGIAEHVELPEDTPLLVQLERHPWRFLNHSCAPNAALRGRELIALRPIAVRDELTFDYATTEWAMAEPFACRCGAIGCRGTVSGYRDLDEATRAALADRAAPWVIELARTGT